MKSIDLFYQGERLGEIKFIEIGLDATVAVLKEILTEKHGFSPKVLVFLEDVDKPIADDVKLREYVTLKGLKVHLHSARELKVTVTFNAKTVERLFAPGTTVARIKRWAAEEEFGMSQTDAGEHVLQLVGTVDRPAPGTHIGALTDEKVRLLAFDLVPDERVQGMV